MKAYFKLALSQYGVGEFDGVADNPEIIKYFDALGYDGQRLKDETAWCAAMANWALKTAGFEHSGKLNARSFLNVGEAVETPEIGDIVVFWRVAKNDWRGHVGFYISEDANWIYCLGGNQGNSVNITSYSKRRLLGYRRVEKISN